MKKEFIPYEQAIALKELGFDEPYLGECFGEYRQWGGGKPYLQLYQYLDGCSTDPADYEYTTECIAPLYQQAFRWFREQYGLCLVIKPIDDKKLDLGYNLLKNGLIMNTRLTYEEAELACLKKLIELSTQTK
jgi:hypothetical protein